MRYDAKLHTTTRDATKTHRDEDARGQGGVSVLRFLEAFGNGLPQSGHGNPTFRSRASRWGGHGLEYTAQYSTPDHIDKTEKEEENSDKRRKKDSKTKKKKQKRQTTTTHSLHPGLVVHVIQFTRTGADAAGAAAALAGAVVAAATGLGATGVAATGADTAGLGGAAAAGVAAAAFGAAADLMPPAPTLIEPVK
jgi:hypothetical protein